MTQKVLICLCWILSQSAFAAETVICVAGQFDSKSGDLVELSGTEPNLAVVQNGKLSLYSISNPTTAEQEFNLSKPFDLSFSQLYFEPIAAHETAEGYFFNGNMAPSQNLSTLPSDSKALVNFQANPSARTGSLAVQVTFSGFELNNSSPMVCTVGTIKN